MTSFHARLLVLAGAVCLAFGSLAGNSSVAAQDPAQAQPRQQQPQQRPPQQPTFRAGVNAVRVDVIVTDRQGTPIDDLTAADFEVIEDGKPQAIDSCKLIRVQTRQAPGGEAPRAIRTFEDEATELARDDVRIIVMLLDDYHVSRMSAYNLRSWLHRFVESQIGPYDLVALMYPLTPTAGLVFTRDRFALASAIDKFEGRLGDYMVRNQIEANYAMLPPARIEQVRSDVVGSAIKSVCYHLGALNEGRKSLIVIAETLPMVASDLSELVDAANRNNVSIYALNPAGLGMFGGSDVLRALAEETNGRAITERNDLETALGVVLRDSSSYYLLGYNSDKGADGKFHEIKVRLKRTGLEVRARKGYWAPTPAEAARASAAPKREAPSEVTASLAALVQPRGRVTRAWLGMARGDNAATRVTFVWEPAPPVPGGGRVERPARVLLVAVGPDGKTYFDGVVDQARTPGGSGAPVGETGSANAGGRAVFDAPPGRLQIKLTVEAPSDPSSRPEVIESEVRDVAVPDLTRVPVALSTPQVFCARTARDFRSLAADPSAVPTVRREFSRSDRLLIRVDAYGQGTSGPSVTARLLTRNGDAMTALPVQASAGLNGAGSPGLKPESPGLKPEGSGLKPEGPGLKPGTYTSCVLDLPLSTLARGDYVIEIAARSGTNETKQMVAIRVAG